MKYARLGNTEIQGSKLCVGCMSFGKPFPDFHEWTYLEQLYVPHKIVGALPIEK